METVMREYSFAKSAEYEKQISMETPINTAERGGIGRVLSVEAEAKLTGAELMAGEASVGGKVNFRVLYLDAAGKLCGLDYFKDFEAKVEGEAIAADGKYRVDLTVVDCGHSVQGDVMNVSAVVDVRLCVQVIETKEGVASVDGAELLTEMGLFEQLTEIRASSVELLAEEKVQGVVKKVLLFDVAAALSGSKGAGEARATVLYLTEDDEVGECDLIIPFAEEEDATGSSAYDVRVKNARVVISGDEDVSAIETEITLSRTAYDYAVEETEVVKDVFSYQCASSVALETVRARRFIGEAHYRETLGGTVETVGDIIAVRPVGLAVAGTEISDGRIRAEGVASFTLLCRNDEGYASTQGELPFIYELPFPNAAAGDVATVRVDVLGVKGRGAGEITAEVAISADVQREVVGSFVTEIAEGAPREDDGAGISVYFAETGEGLWSIAKEMGVAPSALVRANPFLAEPLTEPKKVLVFKGKTAEIQS